MRMNYAVVVWLCVAGATSAARAAEVCEGAVRFTPPAGWSRGGAAAASNGAFVTADGKGTLTVGRSQAIGSADQAMEALSARLKPLPEFREEAKMTGGRHIATGGQWRTFSYSFADPSRPGQFNYAWVVAVAAGGRSVDVTATFRDVGAFNKYVPSLGRMVDGLQITSATVVERGSPPLTRFMLDETNDFAEWLMQSPLTDGQKQTVEDELRGYWKKNARAEIDGIMKLLEARDKLAEMTPEKREVARQAILETAVAEWRKDRTSAAARTMVEIYDQTHKPIAEGTPPLTRQSVDAFTEMLCFAACQTAGVSFNPPAELKGKLAAGVAESYGTLGAEQRKRIAEMPLAWAAVRAAWPEMGDAEKRKYIDAWKQDATIVQLGNAIRGSAPPSSADASSASRGGESAKDVAKQMQDFRSQQMVYQTMSNCMRMQYETNRAIIMNMGSGYHYEYRWR